MPLRPDRLPRGVVSDESVAAGAMAAASSAPPHIDLVHRAAGRGDDAAHQLLCDRATALGRVAAIVRDMVHPDRVDALRARLHRLPAGPRGHLASLQQPTTTPTPIDVSFTRFGAGVQAVAAGTVALRRVFDDPARRHRGGAQLDRCSDQRDATG